MSSSERSIQRSTRLSSQWTVTSYGVRSAGGSIEKPVVDFGKSAATRRVTVNSSPARAVASP